MKIVAAHPNIRMETTIQSLGFKAGSSLEDFVRNKLSRLDRKQSGIVRATVTLFEGPESQTDNKHCEIRLEMPGADPFVKRNHSSWEQAIVDVVDTLDTQLRRSREKHSDHRP